MRWQYGQSLAEAVIALLISAVVLQGLLTLQWRQHQDLQQARYRSQLLLATQELLVRWRLHEPTAAALEQGLAQSILPAAEAEAACARSACASDQRAAADLARFAYDLAGLPEALRWQVSPCPEAPADCLFIGWTDPAAGCPPQRSSACVRVSLP